MNKPRLKTNAAWLMLGQVVYKACQLGILVAIARICDAEGVGIYAFGMAVSAPILMFLNLQLRLVFATDTERSLGFTTYFSLRACTSCFSLILIAIWLAITRPPAFEVTVFAAIALGKAIESISELLVGVWQREELMHLTARSLILRGLATLIPFSLILLTTIDLSISIWFIPIGFLSVLLLHDRYAIRSLSPDELRSNGQADFQSVRKLVITALPLGLATGLLSLDSNIPRYFVGWHLGNLELGVFAAAGYLALVTQTIAASIINSIIPRLAKNHANNQYHQLVKTMTTVFLIFLAGGFVAVATVYFAGGDILAFLFKEEFRRGGYVLTLLFAASMLRTLGLILGAGLRAMRKFKYLFGLQLVSTILLSVCCYYSIQPYGLAGIGWSAVIACGFGFVANLFGLMSYLHLERNSERVTSCILPH